MIKKKCRRKVVKKLSLIAVRSSWCYCGGLKAHVYAGQRIEEIRQTRQIGSINMDLHIRLCRLNRY